MLPQQSDSAPRARAASAENRSTSPSRCGEATLATLAAEIVRSGALPAELRAARVMTGLSRAAADPRLLAPEQRMSAGGDYARHVLHDDPDGRFTIVAIVWGPGQFSPPHAHHTWCAYVVYENALEETTYAWNSVRMTARACDTAIRRPGYCCFSEAGLDQIHRLGNSGRAPAISIHVYGVDRAGVRTDVNRIVALDKEGLCR